MTWIRTDKELPPEDGYYWATNWPENTDSTDRVIAYYDGYGFKCEGIYRSPLYWMNLERLSKKYGKVIEEENL